MNWFGRKMGRAVMDRRLRNRAAWGLHSIVPASFGFDFAIEVMKVIVMILSACTALVFSGCSTYQGSSADEYNYNEGVGTNPASPTMRPGMYPNDIRDPNALTRPLEPPHTTRSEEHTSELQSHSFIS